MRVVFAVLCLGLVTLGCNRQSTPAERAQAVEGEVWSPYCPGRLLIDCTTTQSRELRTEIARRVERGDSEGEVLAWVRSEFGDEAIARPTSEGWGVVVWLVPALIFLIGGAVVVRVVARARSRSPSVPDA